MGKTSRRTKAKKQDFAKVKLKVGKRKPRANNATDTTFRSQGIFVPEQLRVSQDEVLTHRKQSVGELLTQLNHFNATTRFKALNGLKEILSSHAERVDSAQILQVICKLISDEDSEVRKAFLSVLSLLCISMSSEKMSPFFNLLLSHLNCAMSHLSPGVQKDSLKVVDLCIDMYPDLIKPKDSCKMLENFLDLISVKQGNVGSQTRALTLNTVLKNESAIAWRARILTRLKNLLELATASIGDLDEEESAENILQDGDQVWRHLLRSCPLPGENPAARLSNPSSTEPDVTFRVIKEVVPIMFECWLDVCCANDVGSRSKEVNLTMVLVVEILFRICLTICNGNDDEKKHWLLQTYMPSFVKHFFRDFPCGTTDEPVRSRRQQKGEEDSNVFLNMTVCSLAALLLDESSNQSLKRFVSDIRCFIGDILEIPSNAKALTPRVVEKILFCVQKLTVVQSEISGEILDKLYNYCKDLPAKNPYKEKILNFFLKLHEKKSIPEGMECLNDFLRFLAFNIMATLKQAARLKTSQCKAPESVVVRNLWTLLRWATLAIAKKEPVFMRAIEGDYCGVLNYTSDVISNVTCDSVTCPQCLKLQRQIVFITIPHIRSIDPIGISTILDFCRNPDVPPHLVSTVVEILADRVFPAVPQFSLGLGGSKDEKALIIKFMMRLLTGPPTYVKGKGGVSSSAGDLQRHQVICNDVCRVLRQQFLRHEMFSETLCNVLRGKTKHLETPHAWVGHLTLADTLREKGLSSNPHFDTILTKVPSTMNFAQFVDSSYFKELNLGVLSFRE